MNKSDVAKIFNDIRKGISKHSPEILAGLGIASMITTTVLAVKATPKALELIEDEKKRQNRAIRDEALDKGYSQCTQIERLKPLEVVKVAWKPYVPAAVTGTVGVVCLIGASSVSAKRNAALAAAYKLSETALSEYKEKVIETIGEKKEQAIRDKVAQKKVDDQPVSKSEVVIVGKGDVLFLEPMSMRYFTSDIESIRRSVNDINERLTIGMEEYISLSEFYDELGLSHTEISDEVGWNLGKDGQLKVRFPATTADDGRPCLMLEYHVSPRYDYRNLY